MNVDFEKVLKEKLSEETFSVISSSEKELEDWLDRLKRDAERCGELEMELESMKNAVKWTIWIYASVFQRTE